jgi:hypothetical protein
MSINKPSRIRHHRMVLFSLLSLLVLTLVLPLIPYAVAERGDTTGKVVNPGTELWRDVRQRDVNVTGSTQVRGVDAGILINVYGEDWRQFRMQRLIPYGAALMVCTDSIAWSRGFRADGLGLQGGTQPVRADVPDCDPDAVRDFRERQHVCPR